MNKKSDFTIRTKKNLTFSARPLWEHTGSNRGPSACKADALNQLSYAPLFGSANIGDELEFGKLKSDFIKINF